MKKKSRLNLKNIIIFVTLFILLGVSFIIKNTLKFEDEHVSTKRESKVSIGVGDEYSDWTNGVWDISTNISNVGSNITLGDDGLSVNIKSDDDNLDNNIVELTISSQYNGGTYSGYEYYDYGQLYFELPLNLFATESFSDYYYDEITNRIVLNDGNGEMIGYVSLGQISYCEVYDLVCFEGDDAFVVEIYDGLLNIYNGNAIDSASDYNASFTLEYVMLPSAVLYESSNDVIPKFWFFYSDKVDLSFITSTYFAEEVEEEELDLSDISSTDQIVYSEWNPLWGDEISGYDYYITYGVNGSIDYSNEYVLYYSLDTNGTLVAYSTDDTNFINYNSPDFDDFDACSIYSNGYSDVDCTFVLGFDMGAESSYDSFLELMVTLEDEFTDVYVTFFWEKLLEKEVVGGGEDIVLSYPTGTNKAFNHTLISDDAGVGAVNRIRSGKDTNVTWKVEPTAATINKTEDSYVKAFNLWNLTSEGETPYTIDFELSGGYVDSSYNTVTDPLTLTADEYVYKSFYLIDDIEYDYVINASGTEYVLSASDINTYSDKNVYVKISDGTYELLGTISKDTNGNIVYLSEDDRTTNNSNVSSTNPVVLPDNVTDLKITYTGIKAAVYVGVGVDAVVSSSDNIVAEVNDLILNEKDIVLKNESKLSVNSTLDSASLVGTYLTSSYESTTYYGSDSVVNEVYEDEDGYKYDSITYNEYVYEQINYFDGGDAEEAKEFFTEQKNVTIYELLPIGAVLDGDIKITTYGNDTECDYDLTSTENYDGTGRTLLKIDVINVDNNIYSGNTFLQSGYNIEFNILYSYLDNQSYGNELVKDMAYYSNGVLTKGYTNASEANSSSFSSSDAQSSLAKINTTNVIKNSIYITESTTVDKINVTVGTYVKELKNDIDTDYKNSSNVMEGEKYKYKLKYVFSSDYEEITNLVFVDSLENSYGENSYFRGYLESVDTSYLNNLGVTTTIYYSTNSGVDLVNVDLTDINSWSTTKPSDVSKIVAIAISCGDYHFKGIDKVTPMVDINMIAANAYSQQNVKAAYNSSFINYNNFGDSTKKVMNSETTIVTLDKATIELEATTSVGTGTSDLPAIVENSYSYDITLSNSSSDYDIEDITFDVVLPEGISLNTDNIFEVSDNNSSVLGTYNYDSDTRVLTYSLSTLLKNEVKEITIPVDINYATLGDVTSFNASVQLKTLSGTEYNSDVIKLYNKLAVPELEFTKYVDTLDTDDYTDEAMVIIEKGETYSYRVLLNNISEINAKNITVVDTIPEGLTVIESTINNNGVYDSTSNTITWEIAQLDGFGNISLDYDVTVPDDIVLGTKYKSSAHIEVVNPIDNNLMLYDVDTNMVSTLYQIVSSIKVVNTLSGALADTNKEFTYNFEFSGDSTHVGSYDVVDKDGEVEGTLVIDNDGKGTYSTTLRADESVEFKYLLNGVNYTIKQSLEEGYVTTSENGTVEGEYVVITGVTDEVKQVNYSYLNTYSVSTTVDLSAEITYDKELLADMFALSLVDSDDNEDIKYNDELGKVTFDTITFDNVDGTFNYVVSQVNTNVNKVSYDTNTYTISVILTNDGKGNLNKDIKYYNKLGEEVEKIVFVNEYVPNGLIINNVNTSDYVDTEKEFTYKLEITDSIDSVGTYEVLNSDGEKLEELVIDENGEALYEFKLHSEEKITILDLPDGTKYTITQDLIDYYTTVIKDLTYTLNVEENIITHSGSVGDSSIQVNFNNNYVTSGEFTPSSIVSLLEKELEENEFTFMLKDVSEGLSSGYVEYITNTLDGNLNFTTIEYKKPGTYVYEITQVEGDSNHIYYDLSKCLLTVVLEDNGDSTMSVLSAKYEYVSGKEGFENVYSVEPIVPPVVETPVETPNPSTTNPNTSEEYTKYIIVIGMIILVSVLFIIEKNIRKKRLYT